MNAFLKKFWLPIAGAIIILTLFLTGSFDRCSVKHSEAVIEAVDEASLRRAIIDSMQAVQAKASLAAIDSLKKTTDKAIGRQDKEIRSLKDSLGSTLANYEKDTLVQTPTCDSIIDLFGEVVVRQDSTIQQERIKSTALESEVKITQDLLTGCGTSLGVEKNNVKELKDVLKREMTWFKKNEKYVYLGAGVAIPILLKILLK